MKKIFNGSMLLDGKRARVKAVVTDENGYISITGEVTPYKCRTPHICGCCHEEIAKAFPKLRKFLPLHLVDIYTNLPMHAYRNASYFIVNGKYESAKSILNATNEQMAELVALVNYGLHKKTRFGVRSLDESAQELFDTWCEKLGIRNNLTNLMNELYNYIGKYTYEY